MLVPNPLPPYASAANFGFPATYNYCFLKKNWEDAWTFVPWLTPLGCSLVAAPEVGRAKIEYDFGMMKREQDLTGFSLNLPVNLRDWFVLIAFENEGYALQKAWEGIIQDETTRLESSNPMGLQTITAYQWTHLLDTKDIAKSYTAGPGLDVIEIDRVVVFNEKNRKGRTTDGNRSADVDSNDIYFFDNNDDKWTNLDIVEYLLYYFAPDGMEIYLTGQTEALDQIVEVFNPAGKTLWQCLNHLIDRKRGLGFFPYVDEDNGLKLHIFTTVEVDVPVGDKTLPANANQQYFELPSVFPNTHIVGDIEFHVSSTNTYDTIVVRGDRVRVAATFSYVDGTLDFNWNEDIESEYAGVDEKTRAADRYKGVYSRLKVSADWDGECGDGVGGDKTNIFLTAKKDGTFDTDEVGNFWRYEREFERSLFFRVGVDYSQANTPDENPDGAEPDYVPFMAIVKDDYDDNPEHESTGFFYLMDKLDTAGEGCHAVHVRPLDNELGAEWTGSPRHQFAGADFIDPEAEHQPFFDWRSVIITAVLVLDVRPAITLENLDGNPMTSGRTLYIDMPSVQTWYVAPGTVVDVREGELVPYGGESQYVRNDIEKLRATAAYAQAWYGVRRQAVTIPINMLGIFVNIGTLLTEIANAWMKEPVNTCVTGIEMDMVNGRTIIETGWAALDMELAGGFEVGSNPEKASVAREKSKRSVMSHETASEIYGKAHGGNATGPPAMYKGKSRSLGGGWTYFETGGTRAT